MAIIKAKQKEYHARVPNETARDKDLSLEAKGLLCILLSMDDKWKIYKTQIADFSTNGLHSTRTAFNELIKKGYIKDHGRQRDGKGFLKDNLYEVFAEKQLLSDSEPICGFHTYDERTQDNRTLSNYTINSIEQDKKEQPEVLNINTEQSSVHVQPELFPQLVSKTISKGSEAKKSKKIVHPAHSMIKRFWFEEFKPGSVWSNSYGRFINNIIENIEAQFLKNETSPSPEEVLEYFKVACIESRKMPGNYFPLFGLNNFSSPSEFEKLIEIIEKNGQINKHTYQSQTQRTADAINFFANL